MAPYAKLELPYARPLARALIESAPFREWFLKGTKYEHLALTAKPIGAIQGSLRTPGIKNPWWFDYWCNKEKSCVCREAPDKAGTQTDVLLIFECVDKKLALHIEIKRPGDKLLDGQAESYPRRAGCWANPQTRPSYVHMIFS